MKRKLLFAIAALLCAVGVQRVHAAAADYLSGWTEISELPAAANLDDYYFVFVATEADLMMAQEVGTGKIGDAQEDQLTMVYRTPASPLTNKKFVWMLSYDETFKYGIRNLNNSTHYMQSRGSWPWRVQFAWETSQSKWTMWDLAYADGKWKIQNKLAAGDGGGDTFFIGPWNPKAFADNNVVAGNKEGDNVGKFKIYQILRSAYTSASSGDMTSMLLTNVGFESDASLTAAASGFTAPTGWSLSKSGDNGGSHAADYGSSYKVQNSTVPTTADASTFGNNCYVLRGAWSNNVYIYQEFKAGVAGTYTMTYNAQKANSLVAPTASSTGLYNITTASGSFGTVDDLTAASMTERTVSLVVAEASTLQVRLGCTSANKGSGSESGDVAMTIAFDNVSLAYTANYTGALTNAIGYATHVNSTLSNSTLTSAISTAQDVADNADNTIDYQGTIDAAVTTLMNAIASAIASDIETGDVTYILKNPSFEYSDAAETATTATGSLTSLYGWTIPSLGATSNVSLGSSSACDGQAAGIPTPDDGDIYYFNRKGWNSSTNTYTLSTSTAALPVGAYALTIRYKGVDSYESSHTEKGSTIGLNAKQGDTQLATLTSGTFAAYNKDSEASKRNAYFKDNGWQLLTLPFSVTTAGEVTFNIVETMKGGTRTDIVIDNVTLAKLESAWTTTGSDYYLQNGAGQFLAAGNNWGTRAITNDDGLDLTIGGDADGITIHTGISNGSGKTFLGINANNEIFCDCATHKWFAIDLGEGKYGLTRDGVNFLASDGSGASLKWVTSTSDASAKWQFVTKASRKSAMASALKASPTNATFLIQDANFGRNDTRVSAWKMDASNKNLSGGNVENCCAESFHSTFTLSQTITVPNGRYKVRAQATENAAEPIALVYANDETAPFNSMSHSESSMGDCSTQFSAGEYFTEWMTIDVTDETLTIGVKSTSASNWCVWDNFQLQYLGPNIVTTATQLANGGTMTADTWYYIDLVDGDFTMTAGSDIEDIVVDDGTTLIEDEASVVTALDNGHFCGRYYVKSSSEQTLTWATTTHIIADGTYYFKKVGEDVFLTRGGNWGTEAVTEIHGIALVATMLSDGTYTLKNYDHSMAWNKNKFLNSYTDEDAAYGWRIEAGTADGQYYLKRSAKDYLYMPVTKDYARDFGYMSTTKDAAQATQWQLMTKAEYDTYIAARQTATAEATAAAAGLIASSQSEIASAVSAMKATDCTSEITNPTLISNTDGWTVLKYGYFGHATPGSDGNACEVYDRTGGLKQTIEDLPEGLYKVTLQACHRLGTKDDAERVKDEASILAFISATTESTETLIPIKSWYDYDGSRPTNRSSFASVASNYLNTLFIYVSEGEKLTLTIGVPATINYGWTPFMNWTLTRYENYSISEEDDAAPSEVDDVNVTLTRTLAADKWNTFSVPFDFTVAGSPLEGARVMKFNSATDNIITMEDADEVVAGDPYLVKPTSDIVNPTFEGVDIENPTPEAKGTGDYKFKAQLYYTALATDGSVAYLANDGETVKRLNDSGTGKIKGLRAIFLVPKEASAKGLVINFGDADGVVKLDADGNITEDATIYNLAGQRLSKTQKGVNIVNGKKVLVK